MIISVQCSDVCKIYVYRFCVKFIVKGKGKHAPVCAVKACRGIRGIAPHILDLGTRWR